MKESNLVKFLCIIFLATSSKMIWAGFLSPTDALKKAYDSSQILLIATPNHSNYKSYRYLMALLTKVGKDPSLKNIVFERFHTNSPFYESLSTKDLSTVLSEGHFFSKKEQDYSLCYKEWSWTIANFFPFLRKLNRKRSKPILVRTIDGVSSRKDPYWPGNPFKYNPGNCGLKLPYVFYSASANREEDTKDKFLKLYKELKRDEKVIIVYHHAHLIDSFQTCMPQMTSGANFTNWTSQWTPSTWYSRFLEENPRARAKTSLILLDEVDHSHNPNGAFKLSSYISNYFPYESSALDLQQSIPGYEEDGIEMFNSTAFFPNYHEGMHRGPKNIFQIANFLIWSHDSNSSYKLEQSSKYLPSLCTNEEETSF